MSEIAETLQGASMLEVVANMHVQVTVDVDYAALRYTMLRTRWTAMNTKSDNK